MFGFLKANLSLPLFLLGNRSRGYWEANTDIWMPVSCKIQPQRSALVNEFQFCFSFLMLIDVINCF